MKKTVWAAALSLVALLASCDTGGGNNPVNSPDSGNTDNGPVYSPLPEGVYIAGEIWENAEIGKIGYGGYHGTIETACYWTDSGRIIPDVYYSQSLSITVSDGKVLVTGYYYAPDEDGPSEINGSKYHLYYCYWVDGMRYTPGGFKYVAFDNGNVSVINDNYIDNFFVRAVTARNGKVYAAGSFYDQNKMWTCYFVDGVRYDIAPYTISYEYHPKAIAVTAKGEVHIIGTNGYHSPDWYYADGKLLELQGAEKYSLNKIAFSNDKVYVFGSFRNEDKINHAYWVDGEMVAVNLPEIYTIKDYAVSNGKVYMAGYYLRGSKTQACYWVDGERHDLDGSAATAIFVEE